jgi:hypothetical protein
MVAAVARLGCACETSSAGSSIGGISNETTVASVNGESIVVAELLIAASHARGGIVADFSTRYGARVDEGFWTARFGGERPIDALKRKALELAIQRKAEQLLMKQQGILPDASYHGYLALLASENRRRREALRTGLPIYGPQQYGEQDYLEYLISNGIIELEARLPGLAAGDAELRREYEALKPSMFGRGRRRRIDVAQREYLVGEGDRDRAREAAKAAMMAVAERVRHGDALATAVQHTAGVRIAETELDDTPERDLGAGAGDALKRAARSLDADAYGDVMDTGHSWAMMHCLGVESPRYLSFEEARPRVQHRHIERAFEAHVQDLIDRAVIEIDRSVYEQVVVR